MKKWSRTAVRTEKFVKNFVMDAKTDPKVAMDLSILKNGGWNILQPIIQNLSEEFLDENEPWLLIGSPSTDPFLVTQYLGRHCVSSDQHMKKLMSLREGLEHPGGHASWREAHDQEVHERFNYQFRERSCMQMKCSEDAIRIE